MADKPNWAQILTAIVALLALIVSVMAWHYSAQTSERNQSERDASDAFLAYMRLSIDEAEELEKQPEAAAALVLSTAERIYINAPNDQHWKNTAKYLLQSKRDLVKNRPEAICGALNDDFKHFVETEAAMPGLCPK